MARCSTAWLVRGRDLGRARLTLAPLQTRSLRLKLDTLNGARTLPAIPRDTVDGALSPGFPPAHKKRRDEVDDGLPSKIEKDGDETEEDDDDDGYANSGSHFGDCACVASDGHGLWNLLPRCLGELVQRQMVCCLQS